MVVYLGFPVTTNPIRGCINQCASPPSPISDHQKCIESHLHPGIQDRHERLGMLTLIMINHEHYKCDGPLHKYVNSLRSGDLTEGCKISLLSGEILRYIALSM